MFGLKPSPVPDDELAAMERLWGQYATTVLRAAEEFEEQHPEVVPRSKAEEIHAWEEWALGRFDGADKDRFALI